MARFHNAESTVFIAHEKERAIGFTQLYPSFSSISLARIFILVCAFQFRTQPHHRIGIDLDVQIEMRDRAKTGGETLRNHFAHARQVDACTLSGSDRRRWGFHQRRRRLARSLG